MSLYLDINAQKVCWRAANSFSHWRRRVSTCCIRNVFTLKYVPFWKGKAASGWRNCRNGRNSSCWDLTPLGVHPLMSLQTLFQRLLDQGRLVHVSGQSRGQNFHFTLYATKIFLGKRLCLQWLFGIEHEQPITFFFPFLLWKEKKDPEGNLKKGSEKPAKPGNGNGWLDTLGLLQAVLVQWDLLGCCFSGLGDTLEDDI